MSTPTTRRFPRSLAEAFPDERAFSIERNRRSAVDSFFRVVLGVVAVAAVASLALVQWVIA